MARAEAGRQIDKLLEELVELQHEIDAIDWSVKADFGRRMACLRHAMCEPRPESPSTVESVTVFG